MTMEFNTKLGNDFLRQSSSLVDNNHTHMPKYSLRDFYNNQLSSTALMATLANTHHGYHHDHWSNQQNQEAEQESISYYHHLGQKFDGSSTYPSSTYPHSYYNPYLYQPLTPPSHQGESRYEDHMIDSSSNTYSSSSELDQCSPGKDNIFSPFSNDVGQLYLAPIKESNILAFLF